MLAKGLNLTVKIAFIAVLLVGCTVDERDDPRTLPSEESGIIGKELFIEIMAEISITEAAHKSRIFLPDNSSDILFDNYTTIFSSHGVTVEEFEGSHEWWWKHPAAMKSVLQGVTERLNEIEREVNS